MPSRKRLDLKEKKNLINEVQNLGFLHIQLTNDM